MAKRVINRLTAQEVKGAKSPGYYADGGGLYLQVSRFKTKSWVFRFEINGRSRDHGLGPLALVSLTEARDKAIKARKLLLENIDPIEASRQAKRTARQLVERSITFGEAAKRFIASHRSGWKNTKHAEQWRSTLLGIDARGKPVKFDYSKSLRDIPVGEIETSHVMRVLSPVWNSKIETASRIRSRIETVMNYAEAHGFRDGKNPARWKGNLDHLLPARGKVRKVKHQPALPYRQVPGFINQLRQREGVAALLLEFHILTVVRPGNAVRAKWAQIDRQAAVWTIPADQMKGDAEHKVPLSEPALAVLDRMAELKLDGELVFPSASGRLLSDAAMAAVIRRMNKGMHWVDPASGREVVPHGFRSSFRDWAAENLVSDAVAEACLAHKIADSVIAAYKRTTFDAMRRTTMSDWAAFVNRLPHEENNVVAFKKPEENLG